MPANRGVLQPGAVPGQLPLSSGLGFLEPWPVAPLGEGGGGWKASTIYSSVFHPSCVSVRGSELPVSEPSLALCARCVGRVAREAAGPADDVNRPAGSLPAAGTCRRRHDGALMHRVKPCNGLRLQAGLRVRAMCLMPLMGYPFSLYVLFSMPSPVTD